MIEKFYSHWPVMALALAAAMASGCASGAGGKSSIHDMGIGSKKYTAHSIIFNRSAPPSVSEKKFRCEMESLNRSDLRSYRFSNFLSNGAEPDVVVTLAISGRNAGLGIYNSVGTALAEYTNGKAVENMAEFELRGNEGVTKIKWYLGEDNILSVFESYDATGVLGGSENTIYISR